MKGGDDVMLRNVFGSIAVSGMLLLVMAPVAMASSQSWSSHRSGQHSSYHSSAYGATYANHWYNDDYMNGKTTHHTGKHMSNHAQERPQHKDHVNDSRWQTMSDWFWSWCSGMNYWW